MECSECSGCVQARHLRDLWCQFHQRYNITEFSKPSIRDEHALGGQNSPKGALFRMANTRMYQPTRDEKDCSTSTKNTHSSCLHPRARDAMPALPLNKGYEESLVTSWDPQKSLFLQLPGDVRNIVYDFVFRTSGGIYIDTSTASRKPCQDSSGIFALSMTCREIYSETRDLPFWFNTVHLRAPVLQDLRVVRSSGYQESALAYLPPQRMLSGKSYEGALASQDHSMQRKAQEYVTLAMRMPHIEHHTICLRDLLSRPVILQRLRRVQLHLGFQTNNVFLERFYMAWTEILPYVRLLRGHVDLRLSFQLRLSRRLVVDYDFEANGSAAMLSEMDSCVLAEGELSVAELATVNAVRLRVWSGLFGAGDSSDGKVPGTADLV